LFVLITGGLIKILYCLILCMQYVTSDRSILWISSGQYTRWHLLRYGDKDREGEGIMKSARRMMQRKALRSQRSTASKARINEAHSWQKRIRELEADLAAYKEVADHLAMIMADVRYVLQKDFMPDVTAERIIVSVNSALAKWKNVEASR